MKSLAGCLGSALLPGDHSVQHIKACHPTHAQPAGVGAGPLHPPGSPSMSNPPAQGSKIKLRAQNLVPLHQDTAQSPAGLMVGLVSVEAFNECRVCC